MKELKYYSKNNKEIQVVYNTTSSIEYTLKDLLMKHLRKLETNVKKIVISNSFYSGQKVLFKFYGKLGLSTQVRVRISQGQKIHSPSFTSHKAVLNKAIEICDKINSLEDAEKDKIFSLLKKQYPVNAVFETYIAVGQKRAKPVTIYVGDPMTVWIKYLDKFNKQLLEDKNG